jgi:UDP-N-acetylglucosamine--N-acetylmuramyl-(pentapeptide) pyrophosphoryl-undecaprenol N-acetylglucosamine transferase
MDYAYAAADLVVSRAGAGSISELCLLKKPAILVPSPNVAEDHQTKNALAITNRHAALMIADNDAENQLVACILNLIGDSDKLDLLSQNIGRMALHRSADIIVDEIAKIIRKK